MSSLLDPEQLLSTVQTLRSRIEERFPASGLHTVCGELVAVTESASETCVAIAKPLWWLRVMVGTVIAAVIGGFVGTLWLVSPPERLPGLLEFVQVLEPGVNIVVLVGAAVFFLLTVETRIKRRRALAAVNELRDLAHVIDAHQLTKDPDCLLIEGEDTASSPTRELTPFEMCRYLDYCSEMLALVGKIAALYAPRIDDPVALAAVDGIESLTTNLSRKVWQKITMFRAA